MIIVSWDIMRILKKFSAHYAILPISKWKESVCEIYLIVLLHHHFKIYNLILLAFKKKKKNQKIK